MRGIIDLRERGIFLRLASLAREEVDGVVVVEAVVVGRDMEDGMGGLAETAPRVCRRELMGMVHWLIDCGRWLVLLRGVALLLAASSSVVAVVCRHAGRWSVALGWRWRTVSCQFLIFCFIVSDVG
jgi:hypothetical protein